MDVKYGRERYAKLLEASRRLIGEMVARDILRHCPDMERGFIRFVGEVDEIDKGEIEYEY